MTASVTEAPVITPVAVETARWYDVAGVPPMTSDTGEQFQPTRMRVWDRLHTGWCVAVYGTLTDGTGARTARVFTANRTPGQLPAWARRHLVGRHRGTAQLMAQIDRFARDYVVPPPYDIDAERDDIERQLTALAVRAEVEARPDLPRILVRQIDRGPGRKPSLESQVTGVQDMNEAVALLMMVVEELTGVSADPYMGLVDECRRVAAREQERRHAGLGLLCDQCAGPCTIDGPREEAHRG